MSDHRLLVTPDRNILVRLYHERALLNAGYEVQA